VNISQPKTRSEKFDEDDNDDNDNDNNNNNKMMMMMMMMMMMKGRCYIVVESSSTPDREVTAKSYSKQARYNN
jgi:hypothetical protein